MYYNYAVIIMYYYYATLLELLGYGVQKRLSKHRNKCVRILTDKTGEVGTVTTTGAASYKRMR